MKLAAKQAELASCPYVSDAAKGQLESASAPPIRLVTVSSNGYKVAAGNETVLFRHEKTFYHPPGLFVRVRDTQPLDEVRALAQAVADYKVDYVGLDLAFDGMAVQAESGAAGAFKACGGRPRGQSRQSHPHGRRRCAAGGGAGRGGGRHAAALCGDRRQLAGDGRSRQAQQSPAGRGLPRPMHSPR
ncbi:MAG: hypothetical protein R3A10_15035 [Caldilineaceae bacterium]